MNDVGRWYLSQYVHRLKLKAHPKNVYYFIISRHVGKVKLRRQITRMKLTNQSLPPKHITYSWNKKNILYIYIGSEKIRRQLARIVLTSNTVTLTWTYQSYPPNMVEETTAVHLSSLDFNNKDTNWPIHSTFLRLYVFLWWQKIYRLYLIPNGSWQAMRKPIEIILRVQ